MEIVAPDIHLGLAADGNAVNIGAEHLATIDQQLGTADAVVVIGGFAIVVGPKCKAYPAPCGKLAADGPGGVLPLGVGLSEAEGLLGMQMGSRGIAGIAADGYQFARLDGKLPWGETHLQGVAPSCALKLLLIDIGKAFQMTIHAGEPVGMGHIDSIAEAVLVNGKMTDITFSHRINLLTFLIARLDVDATMEMPGTRLSEVAGEHYLVVHRGHIFYIRIADRLGITATACQQ